MKRPAADAAAPVFVDDVSALASIFLWSLGSVWGLLGLFWRSLGACGVFQGARVDSWALRGRCPVFSGTLLEAFWLHFFNDFFVLFLADQLL